MKKGDNPLPPHVASILGTVTCGVLGTEPNVVSKEFLVDCKLLPVITIKLDDESKHKDALAGSPASIVLRPNAWVHADRYAFVEGIVENKDNSFVIIVQKVTIRENGVRQAEYTISH